MVFKAKILVVEDNNGMRAFLEDTLVDDDHDVTAVASGEDALAQIAAHEFDLALLDLKLKTEMVGGLNVLAAIRQRWPSTTVIMLTAHASFETAVDALRKGAHDYLFKPCTTSALRESVRTGLLKRQQRLHERELFTRFEEKIVSQLKELHALTDERAGAEKDRFLRYGGLTVDFAQRHILLDNQLLDLSPTEFALLSYLILRGPETISAQELAREVQGYEICPEEASDVVRPHIYRIRQKTQAIAHRSIIRTVRGVGYRLDV